MKGIIVVDIPETCLDCGFCREIDEGIEACCTLTDDEEFDNCFKMVDDYCQDKPDWCPIKPVPKKLKKETVLHGIYDIIHETSRMGWNACIDKILGVEENE